MIECPSRKSRGNEFRSEQIRRSSYFADGSKGVRMASLSFAISCTSNRISSPPSPFDPLDLRVQVIDDHIGRHSRYSGIFYLLKNLAKVLNEFLFCDPSIFAILSNCLFEFFRVYCHFFPLFFRRDRFAIDRLRFTLSISFSDLSSTVFDGPFVNLFTFFRILVLALCVCSFLIFAPF